MRFFTGFSVSIISATLASLVGPMRSASAAPANVALNRPATASSTYPGSGDCTQCYAPKQAVDANAYVWSRWTAKAKATTSAPQYLDVDLGQVYRLSSVLVQSGKDGGYGRLVDFKLQIRTATSGAFTDVAGATITGNSATSRSVAFAAVDARYVRVLATRAADDGLPRIYNLAILGEAPTNRAPVAKAGADQTITLPTASVALSGSGSDADGDRLTYAWSKVSGGAAALASPTAAKTTATGLAAGTYVFRLTVRDARGAAASDDVRVVVKAAPAPSPNLPPKALAGSDAAVTLPTNSLSLSGGGTDADGRIASYAWTKVSGGAAAIASPTAAKTAVNGLVAGSYVFRLTVKDDRGATASDDVAVKVNPAPAPGTGKTILVGNGSGELVFGANVGAQCGDTVAIRAGSYVGVSISGLVGCADRPITITNSGGQVRVDAFAPGNWGFELKNVKHVVLKSATAGAYGFRIENRVGRVGLSVSHSSENVDVSGVHVAEASHGIAVKTDPACDTLDHVYPKRINGVRIHDNLIENTLYEGMYIGYYDAGEKTVTCAGVSRVVKAERVAKAEVYRNTLKNTGNEAIKLRLCHGGCDIHDNAITGYGVDRTDDSSWCFGIQVGSETYGKVYRNTIKYGYCSAIDIRSDSLDEIQIFGNQVDLAGTLPSGAKGASWAGSILFNVLKAGQKFRIYDNVSTRANGHDVEVTNYAPHAYTGSVCDSGTDVFVTPNAPKLQPCP